MIKQYNIKDIHLARLQPKPGEISAWSVARVVTPKFGKTREIYIGILVQRYNEWTQFKKIYGKEHPNKYWIFYSSINGYKIGPTRKSIIDELVIKNDVQS